MADVFNAEVTASIDENKDYLTEFVGDDKKYKSPADLAKAKAHADLHIQNLNRTLDELRDELKTRKTEEELMDRIARLTTRQNADPPADPPQQPQTETKSGLTKEDVDRMLAERDAERQQNHNLTVTVQKLTEKYGDDTPAIIEAKAKELGVTKDYLRNLAKTTPQIFTSLFTAPPEPKDVFGAPATNRISGNVGSSKDKMSDYKKIRTTDPKTYFGKEHQAKILAAADRARAQGRYEEFMNS